MIFYLHDHLYFAVPENRKKHKHQQHHRHYRQHVNENGGNLRDCEVVEDFDGQGAVGNRSAFEVYAQVERRDVGGHVRQGVDAVLRA